MDLSLTIQATDLLSNDIGTGISVTSVSSPTLWGGTAVLGDGAITYSISEDGITAANGSQDRFTYTITDSIGQTSTANVNINLPDPVFEEIDFIPLALGDEANTTIQVSTLLRFVPPGSEFISVQDGVNVDVIATDFGGTEALAVAYLREHHDKVAQASFTMTYRLAGIINTVTFKTVAADGSIPIGGGSGETPGEEDSVRETNGGYKNRLGVRPLARNEFVYEVVPVNTRFMILRYDQEYTSPVSFQTTITTTFSDLVEGLQGSPCQFFYRNDDSIGFLGPITGGDFDLVYRMPGTTEWYHADPLFNALGENPRLSRDPSPNPPMDFPYVPDAPPPVQTDGFNQRGGVRVLDPSALASTLYPVGTRFLVIQYDMEYVDSLVNFVIEASTTISQLIAAIDAAAYLNMTLIQDGTLEFRATDSGQYDPAYRIAGENQWFHADSLFEQGAIDRRSKTPQGFYPIDPAR